MSKRFIKPPYSIRRATSIDADLAAHHTGIGKNEIPKVHGDGGLALVKPPREPASSRPKPCAFLKKPQESCPFAAHCRPSQEENRPWSDISFSLRNLPRFAPLILAYRGSALPWLIDDRAFPSVLYHHAWCPLHTNSSGCGTSEAHINYVHGTWRNSTC